MKMRTRERLSSMKIQDGEVTRSLCKCIGWNKVVWNEVVMERSDRIPFKPRCDFSQ